jgi:hypothetical protein
MGRIDFYAALNMVVMPRKQAKKTNQCHDGQGNIQQDFKQFHTTKLALTQKDGFMGTKIKHFLFLKQKMSKILEYC